MKSLVFLRIGLLAASICAAGLGSLANAQTHTLLEVEMRNGVTYWDDVSDRAKLATSPETVRPAGRTFMRWIYIADIAEVNGRAAKGSVIFQGTNLPLSLNPRPGQVISDIARSGPSDFRFEIQQADGTPVGAIMGLGINGGTPPPGAPPGAMQNNNAVIGGTGAFLGVRGQHVVVGSPASRAASMAEDPANRRTQGGGTIRAVLHLIPLSRPEIVATRDGPAIAHSNDFSRVNSAKPARAGEILSLFATGLGPTRPSVDPGKPFPNTPVHTVNSPVEVTVNGEPAEVLAAVGYAGAADGYQVNFRIPSEVGKGPATIRLSAAWIAAPEVVVPVE